MSLDNFISVQFSNEDLETIESAIASINRVLEGKAVNLSPEERQQYGCIADRNKVLVDKAKSYMDVAPQTVPPTIDLDEFKRDYDARTAIEAPLRELTMLMEKLRDTKTLLDFDNYNCMLSYYNYVKFLANQNVPGTTTIYEDMKQHYKSNRGKATSQPE